MPCVPWQPFYASYAEPMLGRMPAPFYFMLVLLCIFFWLWNNCCPLLTCQEGVWSPKHPQVCFSEIATVTSMDCRSVNSICMAIKTSRHSWEIWKSPFLAEYLKKYTDNKFLGPWPGLINQSRCVWGSRNCHFNISMKPTWSNSKTRNVGPSTYRAIDFLLFTCSI